RGGGYGQHELVTDSSGGGRRTPGPSIATAPRFNSLNGRASPQVDGTFGPRRASPASTHRGLARRGCQPVMKRRSSTPRRTIVAAISQASRRRRKDVELVGAPATSARPRRPPSHQPIAGVTRAAGP